MRGGFFHNQILVRQLQQVAEECGATARTEVPVRLDGVVGYIDLVITKGALVAVCEPEQESRRAGNDVTKAVAAKAQLLLIVTPDSLTAQACRRQIRRRRLPPDVKLKVVACPLGSALEILRQALTAKPNEPAPVATDQQHPS
jgi:hypothetical protein